MSKKIKRPSMPDLTFKIGEKVQVGLGENHQIYPTLLEDIAEGDRLIISMPLYRGIPLNMHTGQRLQIFFYRDNGRYAVECEVERVFMHKRLRLISLMQLSQPEKQQRRRYFRLPIALDVSLRLHGNGSFPPQFLVKEKDMQPWESVRSNNISETGVSLNSQINYKMGDCVHVKTRLEGHKISTPVELLGVVRQKELVEIMNMPYCRLGIEFLPYEEHIRRNIARFILRKQQQALLMRVNTLTDEE